MIYYPYKFQSQCSVIIKLELCKSLVYGVPFLKICEVNGGNACMTCQVGCVACHVSYIYAMFHIFMPCFIYLCYDSYIYAMICVYLCHVLYIYVMFYIFMP